ncbi:hypothetical protein OG568_57385 (plasmid) [Streptomyces sp. NBC_01450]|uniref:DUF6059 family protein n=1 Tax=Streptomyces sp. NBC_01450 TaxID=2903871 RepID=UPI002E345EDD|nr:DUF6059 family protein [Streptomyces sp. NBC_01450]
MRRLLRSGRRVLAARCLRPLWQSLVVMGAVQSGPLVHYYAVVAPLSGPQPYDPFASYGAQPCGPPPGHPERLRFDLPLTARERRLDRELWPAHGAVRRTPDGR